MNKYLRLICHFKIELLKNMCIYIFSVIFVACLNIKFVIFIILTAIPTMFYLLAQYTNINIITFALKKAFIYVKA